MALTKEELKERLSEVRSLKESAQHTIERVKEKQVAARKIEKQLDALLASATDSLMYFEGLEMSIGKELLRYDSEEADEE